MSSAPLREATRSRITDESEPALLRCAGEKPRPSSSTASTRFAPTGEDDVRGRRLGMLDDVRQSFLRDPEERGLELGGKAHAGRKIDLERDLRPAQLLQPAAETLECWNEAELVERGRAERERQAADALQRASGGLPQGRRCVTRLGERCRSFDRREAEEDGGERRARLVVQLPRDPAPFTLLGREDRVDRLTRHAFREMDGECGARADRFGEAQVVIGEARVGAVLVEGGNDTDGAPPET